MDLSDVHREALERVANAPDQILSMPDSDPDRPVFDQLLKQRFVWTQRAGKDSSPLIGLTTLGTKQLEGR